LLRCSDVCCGSRLCENSEVQFACRRSISISSIWKTNSAGNHCREKTIEKPILRILGSCTFSHSLGQKRKGSLRAYVFRSSPNSGHRRPSSAYPFIRADNCYSRYTTARDRRWRCARAERHLRRVLSSYFQYYHQTKTHLSLDKDCPQSRPAHPVPTQNSESQRNPGVSPAFRVLSRDRPVVRRHDFCLRELRRLC